MITIYLQNLNFYSFHGLYSEEKILGNLFIVNASIKYQPSINAVISINETIDYQTIYEIIEQRMLVATELLETLVMNIANDIFKNFLIIKEIEISITKKNPPIKNFIGNVAVNYILKRNN